MQTALKSPLKKTVKNKSLHHRPKILIAQSTNWTSTSELPYLFKSAGCTVDVFCKENCWLLTNNYFDNWIECDSKKENFEKKLIEYIENSSIEYDWIILADDPLLYRMNNYLADANEDIIKKVLPIINSEYRNILGSKAGLAEFCIKYNLLSPETHICTSAHDNFIVNTIPYPILLKEDIGNGGSSVHLCNNEKEFYNNLKKIKIKTNLIIQQYIKGKLILVEALYRNGELILYNYSEKLKTLNSEFSTTTKRHFYPNREIESEVIKLGRCSGINGFASISYIREEQTGLHYLFEADPRPNPWISYGRFTGADFSLAVKKYFNPETILPCYQTPAKQNKIEVALFHKDFRRTIYRKDMLGFLKWIFNYKGYWKYIPTYDRKLASAQLKQALVEFGWAFFPLRVRLFFKRIF